LQSASPPGKTLLIHSSSRTSRQTGQEGGMINGYRAATRTEKKRTSKICETDKEQANYINALAVSVSPFFEPAKVTLGGLFFSPWVDFLMTLGGYFLAFGELLKFVR
jgi:hypothetical protein